MVGFCIKLSFYGRHKTRADKNFHSYEILKLFIAQSISEYEMTNDYDQLTKLVDYSNFTPSTGLPEEKQ